MCEQPTDQRSDVDHLRGESFISLLLALDEEGLSVLYSLGDSDADSQQEHVRAGKGTSAKLGMLRMGLRAYLAVSMTRSPRIIR